MTSSLTTLLLYATLLVAVLITPYASISLPSQSWVSRLGGWPLCALLLVGAIILTGTRHWEILLLSAFLLLPLIGRGTGALLGGVTAVLLFATAMWWTSAPELSRVPGTVFVALALAAAFLPRLGMAAHFKDGRLGLIAPVLLCLAIGLIAGLVTTPFESFDPLYTAWHHWSALLAPVEAWRGGGLPYRDFPIQYGLGPTTLLMASCGRDCWSGLFYAAIVTNALYFATLAGCAIILTARAPRGVRWLALAALFCASFIWTGFPIQFAGPSMTPAVAGLRFLSISTLLFFILVVEERQIRLDWIGHLIWLVDLFWSPEAAFFGTAIWWPYLTLRDAGSAEGSGAAWLALIRGALRGAIALAIGICALVLTLWLLSGGNITIADFLAYIQHPPGMRPIKPSGAIWIALASIALALIVLARQGLSSSARRFYVCLLGFVAAGTYYLSRSHDNNILNLFPLLVLVLLSTLSGLERISGSAQHFIRAFVHTTLAAMIAFVATFNFAQWKEGFARAGFVLGPSSMTARFTPIGSDRPTILAKDAVAGLEYLRSRDANTVMLFDGRRVMPRETNSTAWTSVNNVANFEPLTGEMIVNYIQRGAASYHRSGWILVGPGFSAWTKAFQTSYSVQEEKAFGSYRAYRLAPRYSVPTALELKQAALNLDRVKPIP